MFRGDPVAVSAFRGDPGPRRRAAPGAPIVRPTRRVTTSRVKNFFRVGFAAHLTLVVLISIGAYAGVLPSSLPAVPHLDKLGHAILIGGLAFFLDGALDHRRLRPGHAFPRLAPVVILVVAGIEEYLQRLSPRRTSDLADFAADVVGVCFFTWLSLRVDPRFTRADRA
jgi:VanZ family protein